MSPLHNEAEAVMAGAEGVAAGDGAAEAEAVEDGAAEEAVVMAAAAMPITAQRLAHRTGRAIRIAFTRRIPQDRWPIIMATTVIGITATGTIITIGIILGTTGPSVGGLPGLSSAGL